MASTRNRNKYDNRKVQKRGAYFEDGNAARRLEEVPGRPKKKMSRTVQKNRANSTSMGRGYIVFLTFICALATGACVHYIKLTAEFTAQRSAKAQLELELNELKADNDGMDLDKIRDRAIDELGMEYVTEDQIKYYVPGNNSYVRQYQDIPEE